ncbi:hypothetical protein BJ878DRAFT_508258 [Calycina marina]|uniref:Uncharacterized protein n=1 Tax=Calycina marina TaxID=1763456 RepID=A0A9P7Z2B4_9HELO|nr:hypothetical protein BJ878DRAFT_508258 [Calycina marina]
MLQSLPSHYISPSQRIPFTVTTAIMSWGSSTPKAPPAPASTLSKTLPLIILVIFLGGTAFVAYHIFLAVTQIGHAANDKMQSKNVMFTKDGMKVGVKEIKNENYVDRTQSILVKAWNLSSWPGYKSRLWNKDAQASGKSEKAGDTRKPYSRHSSSAGK